MLPQELMLDQSAHTTVAVCAFAMVLVIYSFVAKMGLTKKQKPWKTVPGSLPLIGHLHLIAGSRDKTTRVLEEWAEKYGNDTGCFEMEVAGQNMLVVCREDRAMELYSQRPFKVTRLAAGREAINSVGATGLLAAVGQQWKQEKKLISAVLNRVHMRDYVPIVQCTAMELTQKWKDAVLNTKDGVVTLKKDLDSLMVDCISRVILDKDMGCLRNGDSSLQDLIFNGLATIQRRAFSPVRYWRIPFIGQDLDGYGKYYRNGTQTVTKVIDNFEECRNQDNVGETSQSRTFLGKMYDLMEKEGSTLTRQRLLGNILTVFSAGVDTTSMTLLSALYILACNKELQNELREHTASFDLGSANLADYHTQIPLLKSFLQEVYRYHPVSFQDMEVATEIPFCGTTLAKGTQVLVLMRHVMLQKESPAKGVPYGPDNAPPHVFSPCRYLVPNDDEGTANKWKCLEPATNMAFLSFGYGAPSCPGRSLSEITINSVLIGMLQSFDFELAPDHPPVKMVCDLVVGPDRDIHLKLTPRQVC